MTLTPEKIQALQELQDSSNEQREAFLATLSPEQGVKFKEAYKEFKSIKKQNQADMEPYVAGRFDTPTTTDTADWQREVKPIKWQGVDTVQRPQDGAIWNPQINKWQFADKQGLPLGLAPDVPAKSAGQAVVDMGKGLVRGVASVADPMIGRPTVWAAKQLGINSIANEGAKLDYALQERQKAAQEGGAGEKLNQFIGAAVPQIALTELAIPARVVSTAPAAAGAITTVVDKAGKVWNVVRNQAGEAVRYIPVTFASSEGDLQDRVKQTTIATAAAPVLGSLIHGGTRLIQGGINKGIAMAGDPTSTLGRLLRSATGKASGQTGAVDPAASKFLQTAEGSGITPARTTVNQAIKETSPEILTAEQSVKNTAQYLKDITSKSKEKDLAIIKDTYNTVSKNSDVIAERDWLTENNFSKPEIDKILQGGDLTQNEVYGLAKKLREGKFSADERTFILAELPQYLEEKAKTNALFNARDARADKLKIEPSFSSVNRNIDEATYSFTKDNTEIGRLKLGQGKVYVESEGLGTGGSGLTDYQMEQGKKWLAQQKEAINKLTTFTEASKYRNELKVPDRIGGLPVGENLKEALGKQIPNIKNAITSDLSSSARKVTPGEADRFTGNIDDLISAQAKKRKKYGTPADYEAEKAAIQADRLAVSKNRTPEEVFALHDTDAKAIDSLQSFKAQQEIPNAITGLKLTSHDPVELAKVLQSIDLETGARYYEKMSPTGKALYNQMVWEDMVKKSYNPRTGTFSPANMSAQISKRLEQIKTGNEALNQRLTQLSDENIVSRLGQEMDLNVKKAVAKLIPKVETPEAYRLAASKIDSLLTPTSNVNMTVPSLNKAEVEALKKQLINRADQLDMVTRLEGMKNVFQYLSKGVGAKEASFDSAAMGLHGQIGEVYRILKALKDIPPELIYKTDAGKRFLYAAKSTDYRSPQFRILMEQYIPRILALRESKSNTYDKYMPEFMLKKPQLSNINEDTTETKE